MIVRSIASRNAGRRALLVPAIPSCHRFISTDTLLHGLDAEKLEEFNNAVTAEIAERKAKAKSEKVPLASIPRSLPGHWGPKQALRSFKKTNSVTSKIGSQLRDRFVPSVLLRDPPRPQDITLELLMASQTHMGHTTSRWNPANARYIYGVRQGIHLISLETTAAHLRRAARVVEEVTYRGGLVLFVGTRNGQMEIVTEAAKRAGGYHLFTKWTPGNITNRSVLNGHKLLQVTDENDKRIKGMSKLASTARPLIPDLVVCLNPVENYTMLYECGLANVPTIGVIDTDANPDWVTYTIPANDDSFRSIAVIAGVLGRAGEQGQVRRRADAKNGIAQWETSAETSRFMELEKAKWAAAMRRWRRDNAGAEGASGEAQLLEMVKAQRKREADAAAEGDPEKMKLSDAIAQQELADEALRELQQ